MAGKDFISGPRIGERLLITDRREDMWKLSFQLLFFKTWVPPIFYLFGYHHRFQNSKYVLTKMMLWTSNQGPMHQPQRFGKLGGFAPSAAERIALFSSAFLGSSTALKTAICSTNPILRCLFQEIPIHLKSNDRTHPWRTCPACTVPWMWGWNCGELKEEL